MMTTLSLLQFTVLIKIQWKFLTRLNHYFHVSIDVNMSFCFCSKIYFKMSQYREKALDFDQSLTETMR